MRLPFFRLRRSRANPAQGLESVRSLFSKFQRIQKLNTKALELMAEMERALGGEYIFDRAFLDSSVRDLSTVTYQVVYSLNAMSRNRYVGLFDRFQSVRDILYDILGGGLGPFAASLTLPYSALGWELESAAGALNVCLAEAREHLGLLAPDGFCVTTAGCRLLLEPNGLSLDLPGNARPGWEARLAEAAFPEDLEEAIRREMESLFKRRGGPTNLTVRACTAGAEGGTAQPSPAGLTDIDPDNILSACKAALAELLSELGDGHGPSTGVSVALAVHEVVSSHVTGSVSVHPSAAFPAGIFHVTASPVDAPERVEHYELRRVFPFECIESDIQPKPSEEPIYPGIKTLTRTPRGLYRGSALLGPTFLKAIADCAMTLERTLGCPQELLWARGDAERPIILGIRPLHMADDGDAAPPDLGDALDHAEVLIKGGDTAQTGISAGRTVHIEEDCDLREFPYGAIAVAKEASPRLSTVLRRASALVTEVGSSIGHLATIARELRVPAIFGAKGAMERIPEGIEVTVDAGECTVYEGIIEPLLANLDCSTELYPSDPEYVALRRLLRWIMPLDLIDPESSDFSVENCRSYHDIIHFSHERSVDELLHIQDRGRDLTGLHACKLKLDVPIDMFVLDLGGGVSGEAGTSVGIEDVRCEPFRAFLEGLTLKEMWSSGPASISFKDIFSGLDRTFSALTGPPEYAGKNHAIVAESYMNLGLRLGYHFSVVDSYLGANVNQNYIYFRFVGGFADEARRRRRAEFIRTVLEDMRFKVVVKGDLIIGKLKIAEREETIAALTRLGELTGFTRQLDMSMASESTIEQFSTLFREKSIRDKGLRSREEPLHA